MTFKNFEDIPIWKQSIQITKSMYALSEKGLFARDFSLKDQIRRAIVSVSSNIVEGYERNGNKEFIRFLLIAKGSANEVRSQLIIAKEIGYCCDNDISSILEDLKRLSFSIGGFVAYLKRVKR